MNSRTIPYQSLLLLFMALSADPTLIFGQGGGRTSSSPKSPRTGTTRPAVRTKITIWSDPGNSQVSIDGRLNGETDPQGQLAVELAPGRHKIQITHEGFVEQERTISVSRAGAREQFLLPPILVSIMVLTEPSESEVYVDGGYRGLSQSDGRLKVEGVKFGDHLVRAQRRGYLPLEEAVKAGPNGATVRIKLGPDPIVQRIAVIDENIAANRLADAFGVYGELKEAKPTHPDLLPALDRILERLHARSLDTVTRLGVRGLVIGVGEAQDLRSLYELGRKFKTEDPSLGSFANYWAAKYYFLKAQASSSGPERADDLEKTRVSLAQFNSASLGSAYLYYDLGWLYTFLNDRAAATRNFNAARSTDPNWAFPHFALATLDLSTADQLANKKDRQFAYSQALAGFNQAINLNAQLYQAYSYRGILYLGLGKHREALVSAQQAVAISPQSGLAHFALGYVYFSKGKNEYANAEREFGIALSATSDPVDADIKKRIQELRVQLSKGRK